MSFTWYAALQGEDVRAFLPVHVPRETKFRDDLESPLAQGDAVLHPDAHVSPVKPLHSGGSWGSAVHRCVFLSAAESSLSAQRVLIHIQRATRSDWPGARPAWLNKRRRVQWRRSCWLTAANWITCWSNESFRGSVCVPASRPRSSHTVVYPRRHWSIPK